MKNRITQEDINFSRMFCFNGGVSNEEPTQQDSGEIVKAMEKSEGQSKTSSAATDDSKRKETEPRAALETNIFPGARQAIEEWANKNLSDFKKLTSTNINQESPTSTTKTPKTQSIPAATESSESNNGPQNRKPDISFEPVGNTGLTRMVVTDENGNKIPLEEAREKLGLTQENYEKIKNHNSIIDRSQETASNRMRDMWIRKGEKMSDWWKRLDDEQKMGLIGGGFLGGGLLLSNMNKKKRGLGDYISHYGIPAAIAGLSVYGGSAWNADENTYNLGRYNYLMDQTQQQQQNNTATA